MHQPVLEKEVVLSDLTWVQTKAGGGSEKPVGIRCGVVYFKKPLHLFLQSWQHVRRPGTTSVLHALVITNYSTYIVTGLQEPVITPKAAGQGRRN